MSQSDRYVPEQDPLLLPRFHGEVWRRRFRAKKLSFAAGAAVSAATLLFWNSLPMISASADSDSWLMFFPFVTMSDRERCCRSSTGIYGVNGRVGSAAVSILTNADGLHQSATAPQVS